MSLKSSLKKKNAIQVCIIVENSCHVGRRDFSRRKIFVILKNCLYDKPYDISKRISGQISVFTTPPLKKKKKRYTLYAFQKVLYIRDLLTVFNFPNKF